MGVRRRGPCLFTWPSVTALRSAESSRSFPSHDTADAQFEGKKLTEIINNEHENRKYLPGVKLPDNVQAIPDIGEAVRDATVLIFVMPHQCELSICS